MDIEKANYDVEVMNLKELSEYLKLSEKTLIRMAKRGEIPVTKIGHQWRFMRTLIDDWLVSKMWHPVKPALTRMLENQEIILPLSRLIMPAHIKLDLQPGTKDEILMGLIELLEKTKSVSNKEKLFSLLKDREEMASTALNNGVALPHVRNPLECPVDEQCIVLGICPKGTTFDSIDGGLTFVFFLVCTNSEIIHLKMMSKLAYLIRKSEVIKKIRNAKSEKEVFSIIIRVDQEISANE
jgi:PTS system nitrogen regulatory IIA component